MTTEAAALEPLPWRARRLAAFVEDLGWSIEREPLERLQSPLEDGFGLTMEKTIGGHRVAVLVSWGKPAGRQWQMLRGGGYVASLIVWDGAAGPHEAMEDPKSLLAERLWKTLSGLTWWLKWEDALVELDWWPKIKEEAGDE